MGPYPLRGHPIGQRAQRAKDEKAKIRRKSGKSEKREIWKKRKNEKVDRRKIEDKKRRLKKNR